ncbi:MAG: class I SAM-dependent methyltransferase [Candidatus Portnoybacteria bacterium]|nr:class I SAM-dependent methyltransferase [Candidatus Portnoybacteria bacterium]
MKKNWKIWENEKEYGNVFYERAVGEIPEMESSKAIAKIVNTFIKKNDLIMDVGCGGAHYVVSLDKALRVPFRYLGIDSTKYYIDMANKALRGRLKNNPKRLYTAFRVGDIFNIPAEDGFADIVMCANVLLHLPSIEKPLRELVRVAKKYVIVRTLIGNTSFRIRQVNQPEIYDKNGEPANFHFFNIYSKVYISDILDSTEGVKSYKFFLDNDFNPAHIGHSNYTNTDRITPHDLTTIINGMQVNNYIIEPWQFLIIEKQ